RAVSGIRNARFDRGTGVHRVPVPVISVGNLAVGGAGKTPFAAFVANEVAGRGWSPAVVLRGYGGDEVLVHRELNPEIPVFADPRRVDAARAAVAAGCDAVVMDDGFQHRALVRDLDVVLVAAESWAARPRLFPRGPWREGPDALRRAHVAVVTRKSATPERAREVAAALARHVPEIALVLADLVPTGLAALHGDGARPLDWLAGQRVLAVAALADPEPFFTTLRMHGAEVEAVAFADHHAFTPGDADGIGGRAGKRAIVMTLKDAVKLRPLLSSHREAYVLEQTVRIVDGMDALQAALDVALRERT
ncbi:MAG TPA: tetraacyldisaccharide 4'-kinase, partial [Longimicrobiaceae bacterium]|nr:tetraacyldisaccharide 4'-kinase [Longimicrobiaceae bacterium]